MTILTKQAVLFIREDGKQFQAPNGYIGPCPDWVTETKQFKRQVAAGKIVASQTSKDKDMEAAEKAGKKAGKKKDQGKAQGKVETGSESCNATAAEPVEVTESADEATEE